MKKKIIIYSMLFCTLCAPQSHAVTRYNVMADKWETTTEDAEVEYDVMNDKWSYRSPGDEQEFNPHTGNWEWTSGNND